jgi:predicted DCC family thiol-disulfide oxidoreductase YuxK
VETGSREENASKERANEVSGTWPDDDVILYDGVCVFCSRWVRFVVRRDTACRFRFTAIQSNYGTRLAQTFGIDPADPDTNAVVHSGIAWFKSDAALTVLSHLPGWQWTTTLFAVPKPLRDAVYSLVAKNRYRMFGRYEECFVPDTELRMRVME